MRLPQLDTGISMFLPLPCSISGRDSRAPFPIHVFYLSMRRVFALPRFCHHSWFAAFMVSFVLAYLVYDQANLVCSFHTTAVDSF
jgi:hypothetical protein